MRRREESMTWITGSTLWRLDFLVSHCQWLTWYLFAIIYKLQLSNLPFCLSLSMSLELVIWDFVWIIICCVFSSIKPEWLLSSYNIFASQHPFQFLFLFLKLVSKTNIKYWTPQLPKCWTNQTTSFFNAVGRQQILQFSILLYEHSRLRWTSTNNYCFIFCKENTLKWFAIHFLISDAAWNGPLSINL